MPTSKPTPSPPPPPTASREEAPAVVQAQAKQAINKLKDGAAVRVTLTGERPLWCHTQETHLFPGQEPQLVVDRWVKANLERGNIRVVE